MSDPSKLAVTQSAGHVEPLEDLEEEHRRLSERRRRLHQAIDVVEQAPSLKPDAAALLAKYKQSERNASWDRGVLYRKIRELRAEATTRESKGTDPAEDLLRRIPGAPTNPTPDPARTAGVSDTFARQVGL